MRLPEPKFKKMEEISDETNHIRSINRKKTPIDLFANYLRDKGIFIPTDDLYTFKSQEKFQFKLAYQKGGDDRSNQKYGSDYYDNVFQEFKCSSDIY
jgi:hypothetical protein